MAQDSSVVWFRTSKMDKLTAAEVAICGFAAAQQSPTRPAINADDADEPSPRSGAQQRRPTDDVAKAHELRPPPKRTTYYNAGFAVFAFTKDVTSQSASDIYTGDSSGKGGCAAADSKTADVIGCRPVCSEHTGGVSERVEDNGIAWNAGGRSAAAELASQRPQWHDAVLDCEKQLEDLTHSLAQKMAWLGLQGAMLQSRNPQVGEVSMRTPEDDGLIYQYYDADGPVPDETVMLAKQCEKKGFHRVGKYFVKHKDSMVKKMSLWAWKAKITARGMEKMGQNRIQDKPEAEKFTFSFCGNYSAEVMCNTCHAMHLATASNGAFTSQADEEMLNFFMLEK